MQSKNIILFLLLVFLASCKLDNSDHIIHFSLHDFASTKELHGKTIQLSEVQKPYNLKVIPNYNILILLDAISSEYWGRVYSLDSMKLLKKLWKYGSGPNEFIVANNLRYNIGETFISVTDPVKKIIYQYSLDSILQSNDVVPSYNINLKDLKENKNNLHRPLLLDSCIIDQRNYHPDSNKGLINVYSKTGKELFHFGEVPNTLGNYENKEVNQIFAAGMNTFGNMNFLVLDYFNTDLIDVYDLKGNLLKRMMGPDRNLPEFHKRKLGNEFMSVPSSSSHYGYTSTAKITFDKIFLLYNGSLQKSGNYHAKKLFSFTKDLIPVTNYSLDIPIFDFDIDLKHKKIYGLSHEISPKVVIYSF